jgi:putative ABC transport system substrate-binding protein
MRRREFITLLGGAAAAWPLAARGQQGGRVRRVALVMQFEKGDQEGQLCAAAFQQGLEKAGWVSPGNIAIDHLWGVFDSEGGRAVTMQLQRLAPDVIVANARTALRAAELVSRTVAIVFVSLNEPVEQGFVASLAHPGSNITGFTGLEPTVGTKWLELLKELAPHLRRVAFMYNPGNSGAKLTLQSVSSAARQFSLEVIEAQVLNLAAVEAVNAMLTREPGGALVLPPDVFTIQYRKQIVELAIRDRLPTIAASRLFAEEGGLLAYGFDLVGQYRQAAEYVDRILRGEKPGDLPVQQPTKFQLVINLKTAKALDLTVPPTLLATADEVIE